MNTKTSFKNIPPPNVNKTGSKGSNSYQRFIPREELGDFASWQPGTFANAAGAAANPRATMAAAAPAAPPEPTAADWQARIAAARQAGYKEGYADGLVALESFKQNFAQQATAQIGALLNGFDEQMAALDADIAQALAKTAVQLARQVLHSELQARPELVAQVAGEAVNAVMLSARHISVQVHPLDLPLVAEGASEALQARKARLLPNPGIQRGGVLVQSDVGAIDARLGTRWAQAAAAMGADVPLHEADEHGAGRVANHAANHAASHADRTADPTRRAADGLAS